MSNDNKNAAAQEPVPYGYVFTDDPATFAMPGSGFHLGPVPPTDAINVVPLYAAAPVAAAPGIDLLGQAADLFRELQQCVNAGRTAGKLNAHVADVLALIDASPKGGSTETRGLKLPSLPFAVFDEFGVGADDRVTDYGRACRSRNAGHQRRGGGVSAFKTGDRVRIIATDYDTSEDANLANGQTGRVIKSLGGAASIQTDAGPRHVNDDGDGWWFFDSQLELAGDDEQPASHGAGVSDA